MNFSIVFEVSLFYLEFLGQNSQSGRRKDGWSCESWRGSAERRGEQEEQTERATDKADGCGGRTDGIGTAGADRASRGTAPRDADR